MDEQFLLSLLDNTAPRSQLQDLGILKFAKTFFPKRFEYDFADVHYDMIMLLFMLLDPQYEYQTERQAYFLVHREAAKTTLGTFLFPMYLIYMKGLKINARLYNRSWKGRGDDENYRLGQIEINENFILIASETARASENFVVSLRDEITRRSDMSMIFGEKDPKEIIIEDERERKTDNTWRKAAFKTADNTVVIGLGAGQQSRGTNIDGSRPTLVIVDDMYSHKNITTEESREKIRYWFDSELTNSLDSRKGKILWSGTLLHPDTVVKDFDKEDWFGISRPLINVEELTEVIKGCSNSGSFVMPSKEWCIRKQPTLKSLSWTSRHDLYSIMLRYRKALDKGKLNNFYQEFMNEYLAPETKMIHKDSFLPCKLNIFKQQGMQMVEFKHENIDWYGTCSLSIGFDIASSTSNNTDDTVIMVAGYARCYPKIQGLDWQSQQSTMPMGRVFPIIAHIEGGKYSIHNYQNTKGQLESIEALCRRYVIDRVKMEANGQQALIERELRSHLQENNIHVSVWAEYTSQNKADRILSVVLPVIQKYTNILCEPSSLIEKLYFQTLTVGMSDHDDYADAYSIAMKASKPPLRVFGLQTHLDTSVTQTKTRWDQLVDAYGNDAYLYL